MHKGKRHQVSHETRAAILAAHLDRPMGMLGVVFLFVVLGQLLYAMESSTDYSEALYEATMATITGSGITSTDAFSKALQLVLAMYSVVIFATLAGSLGAFFLQSQVEGKRGVNASRH
ncbi:hypothetical protein ACTXJG_01320 [Glutamicibacter arilaitensis]|jgi:voltage-gated potassium channel|uniref:hypothetical protein n=1 Tax=Glutamicibacter arilaitensis TaxID=256701 RepID=UPI003FD10F3A